MIQGKMNGRDYLLIRWHLFFLFLFFLRGAIFFSAFVLSWYAGTVKCNHLWLLNRLLGRPLMARIISDRHGNTESLMEPNLLNPHFPLDLSSPPHESISLLALTVAFIFNEPTYRIVVRGALNSYGPTCSRSTTPSSRLMSERFQTYIGWAVDPVGLQATIVLYITRMIQRTA